MACCGSADGGMLRLSGVTCQECAGYSRQHISEAGVGHPTLLSLAQGSNRKLDKISGSKHLFCFILNTDETFLKAQNDNSEHYSPVFPDANMLMVLEESLCRGCVEA